MVAKISFAYVNEGSRHLWRTIQAVLRASKIKRFPILLPEHILRKLRLQTITNLSHRTCKEHSSREGKTCARGAGAGIRLPSANPGLRESLEHARSQLVHVKDSYSDHKPFKETALTGEEILAITFKAWSKIGPILRIVEKQRNIVNHANAEVPNQERVIVKAVNTLNVKLTELSDVLLVEVHRWKTSRMNE